MKSPVNTFFDKVYVLSLPKDTAKRKTISKALDRLNIDFEFFDGFDGTSSEYDREWQMYQSRLLVTKAELDMARKLIQSRGAWGCLYSYSALLEKALTDQLETFLVLEDDCLFSRGFHDKFEKFIIGLPEKWKLVLLGASQHRWNPEEEIYADYYHPSSMNTTGAFAVGYHHSILREILSEAQTKASAYDQLALGNMYDRYRNKCFVAYPNLVIADVRESNIRDNRDLREHSIKMKWPIDQFEL